MELTLNRRLKEKNAHSAEIADREEGRVKTKEAEAERSNTEEQKGKDNSNVLINHSIQ